MYDSLDKSQLHDIVVDSIVIDSIVIDGKVGVWLLTIMSVWAGASRGLGQNSGILPT